MSNSPTVIEPDETNTTNTLQNVFNYIRCEIFIALKLHFGNSIDKHSVIIELPRDKSHGDFYTNVAMVLAKRVGLNPIELAHKIKEALKDNKYFSHVEIAGSGFINITVTNEFWSQFIQAVFTSPKTFGKSLVKNNKKILIEFVSANPTGPMHVGHCRGAIFGDALANLLEVSGYEITKEFYINDAGGQIQILAASLFIRYQQLYGIEVSLSDNMYGGEYLIPIAEDLKKKYNDDLLNKKFEEIFPLLREFSVSKIMEIIKANLKILGVVHNSFISELNDIQMSGYIERALILLTEKGLLYEGTLERPKGIEQRDWESKIQTIFKSTEYGDDLDRAVQRADGSYTYFAGDLGLALQRVDRGFDEILMVLGADHIGFVKRLKAAVKAIGGDKVMIDVPIIQMVNLMKGGKPFKMSKRAGNFIEARDVIDEVGLDVLRFILLSRKNDTILDFDFEKVKEHNRENPVFYVQYAHARCVSILRNAKIEFNLEPNLNSIQILNTKADNALIRIVSLLPKVIEQAAVHREPHRVINYLIDLATEFHSLWAQGSSETMLRFIIPDNQKLTEARLVLVDLVRLTITIALTILGIKAVEKM